VLDIDIKVPKEMGGGAFLDGVSTCFEILTLVVMHYFALLAWAKRFSLEVLQDLFFKSIHGYLVL
jgi:hypothetical protein